ncbi:hypothetical protein DRP05_09800 [Archaeoglobales archaeon]|nr:MAG: hypothetical protein DRP05_09800 [Archaeoglobales archaeon]
MELFRKTLALILMLIALSLLLNLAFVSFSKTGLEGFIGGRFFKENQETVNVNKVPVSLTKSNLSNLSSQSNPPHVPIYFVEGLNRYTNHMRLYTASEYVDGEWLEDNVKYDDDTPFIKSSGHVTKYKVTPIVEFVKHIPVSKDTAYVTVDAGYNAYTGTFLIKENLSKSYEAFSTSWKVDVKTLGNAKENGFETEMDKTYFSKIRDLALEITKNATTDYEKVKAIEKYLEENYRYSFDYNIPKNIDPVYWFLFEGKRGICKHFASAFAVLCRSIGLQSRVVVGYLAKPTSQNQTVFADQAHMWAEVEFDNGWVEFDPTPSSTKRLLTKTEITYVDKIAMRGENFTVRGIVTSNGTPVENGFVEVFLKKNKSEDGILLGLIYFESEHFEGNITIPDVVGEYNVVAHFVGSLKYMPSWSDPKIKIYSSPELLVKIPDKIPLDYAIRGYLFDYNRTPMANEEIIIKVDGKVKRIKTNNSGFFSYPLHLKRGFHEIEIRFNGKGYILPMSYKKTVEAGEVKIILENNTAIRNEEWDCSGRVYFNDKLLNNATLRLEKIGVVKASNGTFAIKTKLFGSLGKQKINVTILGMNHTTSIYVYLKAKTFIDTQVLQNKSILVRVKDDEGKLVSGLVMAMNKTYQLKNGSVILNVGNADKITIEYLGNEYYLPSKKVVELNAFPYWIFLAILPIAAYFIVTRLKFGSFIEVEVVREDEKLPLIWNVGEEVIVRIRNRGDGFVRFKLNDEPKAFHEKGMEVKLNFEEEGEYKISVERVVNEKIKEKKEITIKIMNYRDAIVETFSNFVKDVENVKKINLKDYTAREIMKLANIEDGKFLKYFELSKYGYLVFNRKDFIEVFMDYLRLRGEIDA